MYTDLINRSSFVYFYKILHTIIKSKKKNIKYMKKSEKILNQEKQPTYAK